MKIINAILKILVIVIFISIGTIGCNKNDSLNNNIINWDVENQAEI